MNEIERYVAELASHLRVPRRDRARILVEARDHLCDAIASRELAGEPREPAVARSLEAFGSPSMVATQFNAEAGARAMRKAPVVALAGGVAVGAGLLVAAITQPTPAVPAKASPAVQVSFFIAALAFQIAFVAGVCAASRALSVWRTSAVRGNDRRFVHRCTAVSAGALAVAALGWATAVGSALDRAADANNSTLGAGIAAMLVGATIAIAVVCRLQVNPADEVIATDNRTGGYFGLGERAIDVVRQHPVVSCTGVATLSALAAMSHAETSVGAALPWGVMQAATVVVAFVVLGPTLGLRRARSSVTQNLRHD